MTQAIPSLSGEACVPAARALSEDGIATLLSRIDGWSREKGAIRKDFRFDDFHRTMAFVNAVAWIAHRADHHPDLDVGYGHCAVTWSTHSAGGLTRNDFVCAARTDDLLRA